VRPSPLSLLALAFLVSVQAKAADPTTRDLIALAPIVSSKDESIKSIEIAGYFASDGKIDTTFRALYQSPGRFAFLMSDGATGTPISFSANRNMLVYDPVRPELVYFTDAIEYYEWGIEDGKLKMSVGHKFWSHDSIRIIVDFKAMFGAPTRNTVVKLSDTQYTLIRD